jgi:hypothetical protein
MFWRQFLPRVNVSWGFWNDVTFRSPNEVFGFLNIKVGFLARFPYFVFSSFSRFFFSSSVVFPPLSGDTPFLR